MIRIGAIGHRDLKQGCKSHYMIEISRLLISLKKKYNNITIYSPLSEGADRLIVEEAIKVGIEFIALLPMDQKHYISDFDTKSKEKFKLLISKAKKIITLPLLSNNKPNSTIKDSDIQRDRQYESAGHYIADSCDIVIALWDEKNNKLRGGTSETINYYLKKETYDLYYLPVSRECDIHNTMIEFKQVNNN